MRHIIFAVTKKTYYLLAALVILTAIAVAVLGFLTPYLDRHLPDFEAWASQVLDMPVKIDKVRLSWYHYQPEISLRKVTVLSKDTGTPLMQIEKVRVFVSLPKSLWEHQPVLAGVMVSGSDLTVKQNASGEFVVQGFPAIGGYEATPYANESKFSEVVGWLSQQPTLILQNVDIRYTGKLNQKRYVTLYNLTLENNGNKHTILGNALLHQDLPTKVAIAAQWLGNVMDFPNIKARTYIAVSGLSLSQWWKGLSLQGWQLNQGLVSAKTWGVWNNGEWRRLQSTFTLYDVSLYSATDHSTHVINRFSGNIGWKRSGDQQIMAGDDLLLDLPAHLWSSTSFYVQLSTKADKTLTPTVIKTGYINLPDILNLLNASPAMLPDDITKLIHQAAPTGDISHAEVVMREPASLLSTSIDVAVKRLNTTAFGNVPGVSRLTGELSWNGTEGHFHVDSTDAGITLNAVFLKPLTLGAVKGDVVWKQNNEKQWQVTMPKISLTNDDLSLVLKNSSLTFDKALPTVDISGSIAVLNAAHLASYFPMRVFEAGLQTWLRDAFLSGEAQDGSFVLRGNLSDYPFDQNNGEFQVKTHVKNLTLRYAPDWPVVEDIDASLVFSGRNMTVNLNSGRIVSIPVSGVQAVIPNLGAKEPTILTVSNIKASTDFSNGLSFVHQSPLEKTLGKMFESANVSGPMVLTLGLTVPLDNPDNTTVDGHIQLSDADLNLAPWRLDIQHLTGLVNFSEKSTDATNLQGALFGEPLTLSLATIKPAKGDSYVQATVASTLKLTDLQDWLHLPLAETATGALKVNAVLQLAFNQPMVVNLQSDLVGVSINAPTPYGKTESASIPFSANIIADDNQPLKVKLSYGDLIQAAMLLTPKNDRFDLSAATVLLGKGDVAWPTASGLVLAANFETLDWDTIQSYQSQMGGHAMPAALPLKSVDVSVKRLSLLGQAITNASITARPVTPFWEVALNSDQIVGSLRIPMTINAQSEITADLSRVNLSTSSNAASSAASIQAKALPSLSISADNVQWNGMNLGELILSTAPASSGLRIEQLALRSRGFNLNATGSWNQSGARNTTQLQGTMAATALSDWLTSLGIDAHNLVATKAQGNFKLSWNASPANVSLSNMNGSTYINLGAGRIVDVADTNGAKMDLGKMLSIFSLQTIPRRLSLDFSDVFQKGYSFDSFKGDFNFSNGNAVTNNSRFDGPVARVGIDGAIGLAAKNYDFTLSVTPYVTSSIPVAAAIISGPVAGIAALAVNKIISSTVQKATTYYYAVGGSWANPTWKEIKSKTAP